VALPEGTENGQGGGSLQMDKMAVI
jgi:hypothetical protein